MKNIAVLFPCREEVKERLEKAAPNCHFDFLEELTVAEREEYIKRADAIIGEPELEELQLAKQLSWLQISWAGTDKYTKREDFPEQVVLTNTTGVFGESMAEWLLGVLLSIYKKLPDYRDRQREHSWKDMGKEKNLYGKTVLILGVGDIGTSFARLLSVFGTKTIGVGRRKREDIEVLQGQASQKLELQKKYFHKLYTTEALDELLPKADVVVMALPDTKETKGLMDLRRLRLLKEDAVLLNVGRGTTLVTKDLITVLKEGKLYGVGLDVMTPEPLPENSPLWEFDRVLLTPHIAGKGLGHLDETYDGIVAIFEENIKRFACGEPLLNVVDVEAGYKI